MQKPKVNRERQGVDERICDLYDGMCLAEITKHAFSIDPNITLEDLVINQNPYDEYNVIWQRLETDLEYDARISIEEGRSEKWESGRAAREAKAAAQKKRDVEREIALLETRLTELKLHGLK